MDITEELFREHMEKIRAVDAAERMIQETALGVKGMYYHEITFETKQLAEDALPSLPDPQKTQISEAPDENIVFFVEAPLAVCLSFYTSYPLDERTQATLSRLNGLLPEMQPTFNLDPVDH